MLQSTYRPASRAPEQPALPSPWTQHKAPSGHIYYYNPETKQSTYTHPAAAVGQTNQPLPPQPFSEPLRYSPNTFSAFTGRSTGNFNNNTPRQGNFHHGRHNRYRQPQDRPKSKLSIPGCSPWIVVKTKLGRRFVHNPTTSESYWKIPDHLSQGISELDSGKAEEPSDLGKTEDDPLARGDPAASESHAEKDLDNKADEHDADDAVSEVSDEYEEVEVTDEEDYDGDDYEGVDEENPAKRRRLSGESQEQTAPVEFGEDDMAYQLAQMGESYANDPGEFDEGEYEEEWEDGADGQPISNEEAESSFRRLLDDYRINPFTTWDAVISDGAIIDDDRYTGLPNMKARRDVFASWSTARIQALKADKDKQTKLNPLIPYLTFLEKQANPKLFWAEFKRKHKREPELKDTKLSDKEREKLYREHITRITKLSEEARTKDLKALLHSIPSSAAWNRATSLDDLLPAALLTDVRFISLPSKTKNPIIIDYLKSLPVPEQLESESASAANFQQQEDDKKLERAMKRREMEVQNAKRQQEKQIDYGKRRLHGENLELQKAMKVDKGALGRALEDDKLNGSG